MSDIKKQIKSVFTDGTNEDWDFAKVFGAVGIIVYCAISWYAFAHQGATFDGITFGTGFSIILGAAGGVSKLKDRTVPEPKT